MGLIQPTREYGPIMAFIYLTKSNGHRVTFIFLAQPNSIEFELQTIHNGFPASHLGLHQSCHGLRWTT
ncbi:hypothetical protein RZS08_30265, partial [Arthrospira platensis SPKY1]|nr:hypothetical protein [Arthrospira platensis SPKY1]